MICFLLQISKHFVLDGTKELKVWDKDKTCCGKNPIITCKHLRSGNTGAIGTRKKYDLMFWLEQRFISECSKFPETIKRIQIWSNMNFIQQYMFKKWQCYRYM